MKKKGIFGILAIMMLSIVGAGAVMADAGHGANNGAGQMNGGGMMMHDFDSGREFGQHVSMHAQDMGFSGDHNPGVHHRGFSPWAR